MSTKTKSTHSLIIEPQTFREHFPDKPFFIQHKLADHPLFTLPSLIALAQRMPEADVEYNAGDLPVNQDYLLTPRNGLSIEETIRRIEENSSWMALKYVQHDPVYAELINSCLDELQPYVESIGLEMCGRQCFIFISSPSSVTPYHVDPEHNFLLQIRGSKTIRQWDPFDRAVLGEVQLEAFYSGGHRNQTYQEEYDSRAVKFDLAPGFGLYFPVNCPHWVKNGSEVSISFSITFHTPLSIQRALIHQANGVLRRWGINPSAVGLFPWRDAVKIFAFRVWNRGLAVLGRTQQKKY